MDQNDYTIIDSAQFKNLISRDPESVDLGNQVVTKEYVPDSVDKDPKSERSFRFTISTADEDRDGDTISTNGWDLRAFKKNPVVLFAHDARTPPIAKARNIKRENGALKASAQFMPPEINEFSDSIFQMINQDFLRATSVGFRPLDFEMRDESEGPFGGVNFTKQELMEFSIVPVPANPEALIEARSKGIPVDPYKEWLEQVLDDWMNYKNLILIDKDEFDQYRKAAEGNRPRISLSIDDIGEDDEVIELDDEVPAEFQKVDGETIKGDNLAAFMEGRIQEMVEDDDDRNRSDVVEELAEAAGITTSTVNQILNSGINCPPTERLQGFADVLDVNLSDLQREAGKDGCEVEENATLSWENLTINQDSAVAKILAERIEAIATETRTPEVIVGEMAEAAEIDMTDVLCDLTEATECPPGNRLEAYATALNLHLENLKSAAAQDGSDQVDSDKADMDEETEEDSEEVKAKGPISFSQAHSGGTPKKPKDTEWNGPREVSQAEVSDLRVMSAWRRDLGEDEEPDKQDFKLPHHVAEGEHAVVWRGAVAAMGALLGARGGVDVPNDDRRGIYNHLARHYREFDEEPPEFEDVENQVLAQPDWVMDFDTGRPAKVVASGEEFALAHTGKQDDDESFVIESIAGRKSQWDSKEDFIAWAKEHDFHFDKVDETDNFWRLRQADPDQFQRLRTICINPNDVEPDSDECKVQAVGGPKKAAAPEAKQSDEPSDRYEERLEAVESAITRLEQTLDTLNSNLERALGTTEQGSDSGEDTKSSDDSDDTNNEEESEDLLADLDASEVSPIIYEEIGQVVEQVVDEEVRRLTGKIQ